MARAAATAFLKSTWKSHQNAFRLGDWTRSSVVCRSTTAPPYLRHSLRLASSFSSPSFAPYTAASPAAEVTPTTGEEAFRQYQHATQKLALVLQAKEHSKSQQMYKAWQQADESAKKSDRPVRVTGVAVVKTIVKQANGKTDSVESKEDDYWRRRAQDRLEVAGLHFGHSEALVVLGNQALDEARSLYRREEFQRSSHELKEAMDLYKRAASLSEAWFNLGHLHWTGFPDQSDQDAVSNEAPVVLPSDRDGALKAFQKAADLGDADAMYFLGVQKLSTMADESDLVNGANMDSRETWKEGLRLVEAAADMMHGGALYYVAVFYLNGHKGLQIPASSTKEFVDRLDAAAARHEGDALFMRGHCWYHGDNGYTQDFEKALEDFLLAADEGNADAAVSAGAILHSGRPGIARDRELAFQLYQRGGELGSIEGWRNVVDCYLTGEGVPRSVETAKYIARTMLPESDYEDVKR